MDQSLIKKNESLIFLLSEDPWRKFGVTLFRSKFWANILALHKWYGKNTAEIKVRFGGPIYPHYITACFKEGTFSTLFIFKSRSFTQPPFVLNQHISMNFNLKVASKTYIWLPKDEEKRVGPIYYKKLFASLYSFRKIFLFCIDL